MLLKPKRWWVTKRALKNGWCPTEQERNFTFPTVLCWAVIYLREIHFSDVKINISGRSLLESIHYEHGEHGCETPGMSGGRVTLTRGRAQDNHPKSISNKFAGSFYKSILSQSLEPLCRTPQFIKDCHLSQCHCYQCGPSEINQTREFHCVYT